MRTASGFLLLGGLILTVWAGTACGQDKLAGKVRVDGSSTVYPITSAAAEMFRAEQPKIDVKIGISGTGNGFKKFLDPSPDLRTDISDASRPIMPVETDKARELGIEYIELPVGIDGMAVVVNPKNTFCDSLTVAELKAIWEPGSKITSWKDVRAGFPDVPLKLYGPGTEDGTYDYFVEAVLGNGAKSTRSDFNASENDNQLVQGVSGDTGGLGYFGYCYYEANKTRIKVVGVDPGDGKPVKPSLETIRSHEYHPLSRPLFIYVNKASAQRPEVAAFVNFMLNNAEKIVSHPKVGYVALPKELYDLAKKRFETRTTGSMFADPATHGKPLTDVYLKAGTQAP